MFSAPMNTITRGKIPLRLVRGEVPDIYGRSPRYHSDPEAHESTDTQASYSTNKNLNSAGEDQTYSVMYRKPFPHGLAQSNCESQVGEVDEHS
jgi:hypothetical protein